MSDLTTLEEIDHWRRTFFRWYSAFRVSHDTRDRLARYQGEIGDFLDTDPGEEEAQVYLVALRAKIPAMRRDVLNEALALTRGRGHE
jgi:hypothetical protein